jgi:hypothetical protein
MRSVISVVGAVSLVWAQVSTGFAQSAARPPLQPAALNAPSDPAVNAQISQLFSAYPKGGDQLSKRISDLIVKDPKLAVGLVRYVQTAPGLVRDQKVAAEHGLADALTRMGVKAADMPVAPVQEVWDPSYLLALLALAVATGLAICFGVFCKENNAVSPH